MKAEHHVCQHWTHISLDHLTALGSDSGDKAKHVHLPLSDHHVQHGVNHNESTCPPNARADGQKYDMQWVVCVKCRDKETQQNEEKQERELWSTHLQWTTMGPAYWGLQFLTFLRNFSIPIGVKGTPKSGQLVKWNWVTSLWGFFPDTSPTWGTNKPGHRAHNDCYLGLHLGRLNDSRSKVPSLFWILFISAWCDLITLLKHQHLQRKQEGKHRIKQFYPGTHSYIDIYLLDAELADGVVHQNHCVFDRHTDVPVCPAALVRPVLGTLTLKRREGFNVQHTHKAVYTHTQSIRASNYFSGEKKGENTN